jgi:hypothetical protein
VVLVKVYVVKHVRSGPGYEWVDLVAGFTDEAAALAYRDRARAADRDDDDDDHCWHVEELPLAPVEVPVKVQYRWKAPA